LKYVVLDSFRADYARLSRSERALFKVALAEFVAGCDRYAANPAEPWPASLRVRSVEGAPGIWEMTWSFSGSGGRATFEWVEIDVALAVRWRRIGGHRIFTSP
jgi:hypothetical protein